jgi:glutamate synthase (NADPH/NADH) small chain
VTRTGFLEHARHGAPKRPVDERVRDYREVYLPLPVNALQEQANRCMDCGVAFCHHGCPLGNLIPEWNEMVGRDDWEAAAARLHLTNNFPEFTGRLCPAPCEPACVLAINDDAVSIKLIEQSIIDRAFSESWVRAEPLAHRTGKRVAVVGSGPAGLAAAQQLNSAGHLVTVYEKADRVGGLLRYGIPDFKMEKWVLDRRLALLEAEGIVFETGYDVGKEISVKKLRELSDAVVLAMDYLIQQNRRVAGDRLPDATEITAAGKRVIIIGGGDTGADCYGNAIREGCASLQQLYIYPQPPDIRPDATNPWPEWPLILRTYPAHEEGGSRDFAIMVTAFSGDDGTVQRAHTVRVEPQFDDGGRRFVPVQGTESTLDADLVLLAIGFAGTAPSPLLDDLQVQRDQRGNIVVDTEFATPLPGVFAAGDASRGASLIVWAIADGRNAARACDRYLMGATQLR